MPIATSAVFAVLGLAQSTPGATGRTAACGALSDASAVCLGVFDATGNAGLARLSDTVLVKPAKITLILVVAVLAQRIMRRAIRRFVQATTAERAQQHHRHRLFDGDSPSLRRTQRAETIGALLRSISGVAIWTVAIPMVMSELGLNLGPLIAGAGIVGVALGFGAQHLVKDFVSGIFMLAEDQYGVGDTIDAGPATGIVESISLRTTRLRDVNGTVWHVPNGEIARVGNKSQQWARAVLDVDVAYDTDIERATEVIKQTADAMWREPAFENLVLEEPEVWGVENLGADGIAIRLVVKTAPQAQFRVARALRARIKSAFDEAAIEIPFPQRTIWHRMEDGAPALVPAGPASPEHDGDRPA